MTSDPQMADRARLEDGSRLAADRAAAKDPVGMLEALHSSGMLVALARRIHGRYGALDRHDADQVVALTVDKLYAAASQGQPIHRPVSWLVKVSLNTASDYYKTRQREIPADPAEFTNGGLADATEFYVALREGGADEAHERRVRRGLVVARELLPQLGQKNVQRVMELYIDAVESGVPHLPDAQVAEILGTTASNVRVWKKRGFERLQRKAREAGFADAAVEVSRIDIDKEKDDD